MSATVLQQYLNDVVYYLSHKKYMEAKITIDAMQTLTRAEQNTKEPSEYNLVLGG